MDREGEPHSVAALDLAKPLEVATAAAREAGAILLYEFLRPGGPRGGAGHCDADAEAERAIQRHLAAAFPEHRIRGEELGTLQGPGARADGPLWLVDPNDGTSAYLKGLRGSAVSIGLVHGGEPVLGVVFAFAAPDDAGEMFTWAQGQPLRRAGEVVERAGWHGTITTDTVVALNHSSPNRHEDSTWLVHPGSYCAHPSIAYRLALAAAGDVEAAISTSWPGDYDCAGGHALVRGAGGELFEAGGRPVRYQPTWRGGNVAGGSPAVARRLAERLAQRRS